SWPFLRALWCVKLDICLIIFSLMIALYADTIFAVLGLGQVSRAAAGARAIARFGVIERSLKIFFMTVDDMSRVASMGIRRIKSRRPRAELSTAIASSAAYDSLTVPDADAPDNRPKT